MSGVNKVIILGRLGRDPEIRHTQGGSAVCNMSVATSRKWRDKSNNDQEETEWHRIVVWGNQAEPCAKYLSKGREVYVEGRLKTNKYTDKEGVEKYATEIVAERVQFIGGRSQGGQSSNTGDAPYGPIDSSDDIPF